MTRENVTAGEKTGGGFAPLLEYIAAIYVTGLVTGALFIVEGLIGYRAIALFYLLLVVVLGMKLRRGPVLLVAVSSGLVWDFFFIPTRFSLHIANIEDLMMLAMFFIVAMALGHLTSQLQSSEMAERGRQRRTAALYDLVVDCALGTATAAISARKFSCSCNTSRVRVALPVSPLYATVPVP